MLKCIVWDLDGTIWDGELGGGSVTLREGAAELIRLADARGVLQSIASKSDPEAAMEKLSSLGIDKFFLYPQIAETVSKAACIRKIAKQLNIDTDSVAFIDDSPFERYEVRRYLPEVSVYAADDLSALHGYLEGLAENGGQNRRELMLMREKRLSARQAFLGSREEFLKECRMVLTIREALADDLIRAAELASRANKLNNTRERPDEEHLSVYMDEGDKRIYVCELDDIFGCHGIVGVCLLRLSDSLYIDLFCISCRVEGRGIGAAFLGEVIRRAAVCQKKALCAYKQYKRDISAYLLLKMLGFTTAWKEQDISMMRLELPCRVILPEWIKIL